MFQSPVRFTKGVSRGGSCDRNYKVLGYDNKPPPNNSIQKEYEVKHELLSPTLMNTLSIVDCIKNLT